MAKSSTSDGSSALPAGCACGAARVPRPGWKARLAVSVRRFRRDARGMAAVEFGLIAPILLVILLGTVEIGRAISIDRRFALVTTTVADLVAREDRLTAAEVNAIYEVAKQIMLPYEWTPLKLSLIPVAALRPGTNVVYPATNRPPFNGGTLPARCAAYPLSDGMLAANESVIVVEGQYTFTPLFAGFLGRFANLVMPTDWSHKAFAKPRKSAFVDFGDKFGTCST